MDIELLRTFLEVGRTRHFGRAAENLHVGQSTVSARIRQLEALIGQPVFTRARNDIEFTAAGLKLLPYAESVVSSWQRARQELLAGRDTRTLAVAGVPSLWDPVLLDWVGRALAQESRLSINAEVLSPEAIARRLSTGSLDLAFAFDPVSLPGLQVREMMSMPLLMVSTRAATSVAEAMADYIYVDWGTAFSRAHAAAFPDSAPPRLHLSTGRLAQGFLRQHAGTAYLAEPMVAGAIAQGDLFVVDGAPVLERAVFALFAERGERRDLVEQVLQLF